MRRAIGLVAGMGVALAGATMLGGQVPVAPVGPGAGVVAAGAGLTSFDACPPLLDHLRVMAARDPWGATGGGVARLAVTDDMMAGADGAETAAPAPAAASAAGTSDTNVQVVGVDEPDLVETDGRRLFTVLDGVLHVVDVSGPSPTRLAEVPLGVDHGGDGQLLLDGDRLLVLLPTWQDLRQRPVGELDRVGFDMPMGAPVTTVHLLDVATDIPVEIARLEVEGELVAGRGIDGIAHLVVAHRPVPVLPMVMEQVWSAASPQQARVVMTQALAGTDVGDWLPRQVHHDLVRGAITTQSALACEDVARPVGATDTSMLQVLTIDLHDDDAQPEHTSAVLTDARSITATADQLVVATPVWPEAPMVDDLGAPMVDEPIDPSVDLTAPAEMDVTTRLHLFDLGPEGAVHRASGEVPGALLNQFSMSLHEGHLRVATTSGATWDGTSESGVTILRQTADRLDVVGAVGGLGVGETIHAVRFLGDTGYVVTFRQTDPLYTLDLSDPARPRVLGELKITGYSAYLHPMPGGRLLGVGQEATLEGQVTGTAVSLFDVADLAAPTRLSQVVLPGAGSEAEWDHHAVLVHGDLLVLPYERWGMATDGAPDGGHETGAAVVELGDATVTLRGVVAGTTAGAPVIDPWMTAVRRALVVDGRLVTVARGQVSTHDVATLQTTGSLPL